MTGGLAVTGASKTSAQRAAESVSATVGLDAGLRDLLAGLQDLVHRLEPGERASVGAAADL